MTWKSDQTMVEGSLEREFVLDGATGPIPGVMWSAEETPAERLLLLGHGGTADKRAEYITAVARLANQRGFDAVAIDGPGHGERADPAFPPNSETFFEVWNRNGGTQGIVADWTATIDFLDDEAGRRPTGWWGLSMGTMVGLPVCVAEPRISVAVLGLMGGWGPNGDDLVSLAPSLSIPLRFLVQWDDEVVPRTKCFELFGLLGSRRKTMHANPGAHAAVPVGEVISSVDYLSTHVK